MINKRVENIIQIMTEQSISPYEVSQGTSLSQQAVDKIKNRKSLNPRSRTLDEIEDFLNNRNTNSFKNNDSSLLSLEKKVIEYWDKLKELPAFKLKLEIEMKDRIIKNLKDIIENTQ